MPGGDGTGPIWLWMSGPIRRPLCMGFGGGFGRGWRFRNVYRATGLPFWARVGIKPIQIQGLEMSKEQELQILKNQANIVEQQLNEIKKRIDELKNK